MLSEKSQSSTPSPMGTPPARGRVLTTMSSAFVAFPISLLYKAASSWHYWRKTAAYRHYKRKAAAYRLAT